MKLTKSEKELLLELIDKQRDLLKERFNRATYDVAVKILLEKLRVLNSIEDKVRARK